MYSFRNNFRILFVESSANHEVRVDHYLFCNRMISRELFGVSSPRDSSSAINMHISFKNEGFRSRIEEQRMFC